MTHYDDLIKLAEANFPHVPAAFINAIREEGTKEEACNLLQKQWNETCALKKRVKELKEVLRQARIAALFFGSHKTQHDNPIVLRLIEAVNALATPAKWDV